MAARDVFRFINDVDEATIHGLINRLEYRGQDPTFSRMRDAYLDKLHLSPSAQVLELGCGTGMTLAALARAGVPAWGVDLSGPMLAQARRRAPGRLVRARAQHLPVRSGSIGCVLSIFPTPYILDPATWAEVARVLQPGGRFIVVDYGWLQPRDPLRLVLVGLHHLVYGHQTTAPPRLPTPGLPAVALTERTPHGFVSVYIATR